MIRRRGAGVLWTALVLIVFGIYTILWLPGTPFSQFEDVRLRTAPTRGVGSQGQRILGEGADGGDASVRMDGGSQVDSPDGGDADGAEGDTPVTAEENSSADSSGGTGTERWQPPPPDDIPLATSKANEQPAETAPAKTSDDAPDPPSATLTTHPIALLVQKAAQESDALLARQSTTLSSAVAEYHRRYNMSPPPLFDTWFAFAQSRNVTLLDEFDTVHDMLLPYWGLEPATLRRRATEALGYANSMQGVLVRGGKVASLVGGRDWERAGLADMVSGFVEWLPDMDLVFNALDEPRVVLPHEDLSRLIKRGRAAHSRTSATPLNAFSSTDNLGDGRSVPDVSTSRFVNGKSVV